MADEQPKIKLDKFTAKVVPDPKNPGQSLCLQGFLGAAPDPAQTRLYWDASLVSFVDINNADILHSEPLPKEQSPLGGSYLWVSSGAEVTQGTAGGQSRKGKFFEGPLMSAYGGTVGSGAGTAVAGTYAPHCWYSWNACPTLFGCGPHHTPACPMVEPAHALTAGCPPNAAAGAAPAVAGSYAPHCWYSWNACPTLYGCAPHHTPACPMVERPGGGGGGGGIAGSYAPGCWYRFNACPTMYGCGGPHHTPACPI